MTSRVTLCGLSVLLVAGCGTAARPARPAEPTKPLVVSTSIGFGHVPVGMRVERQVVFSNPASIDRALELHIEGELASEFGVAETQTLAPGESAAVDVWFSPAAEGVRGAKLSYAAGEETGSIELAGIGVRPLLRLAEDVDFGTTHGPAFQTIGIYNAGDPTEGSAADLLFGAFGADGAWASIPPTIEGENATDFKVVWPPLAPEFRLAPEEGIALQLRFAPGAIGVRRATLRVRTNDPDRPDVRVALHGEYSEAKASSLKAVPDQLSIRAVVGETQLRNIQIRNEGSVASRVDSVSFVPGSSLTFSTDARTPFVVPAGVAAVVQVEITPSVTGQVGGTLVIESGTERIEVPVSGWVSPPVFVSAPRLDFGNLFASCGSRDLSLALFTYGTSPWRVDSVEIIGGPEFKLTQRPDLPALTTEDGIRVGVTYAPVDVGDDVAVLRIVGAAWSVDVPLSGRGMMRYPATDLFVMTPPPQADVLFVIDDSPSMADNQQAVATNLESVFRELESQPVDWHVAVTSTSVDAAHGGAGTGVEFANGRFTPLDGSRPRVITPATPAAAQVFAQNAAVGASTPGDGYLLRPVELALSQTLLGGENAGFLRDDAYLSIILVSDGADRDLSQSINDFVTFLLGLKTPQLGHQIAFSAVIPTAAAAPAGCSYDGPDAGQSTRVKDAVRSTGGIYTDICSANWASRISSLNRYWVGGHRNDVLYLSAEPDLTVAPEPIEIRIDGVAYPQYGVSGELRWSFDVQVNAIKFEPQAVPELGSNVTVTYLPTCH